MAEAERRRGGDDPGHAGQQPGSRGTASMASVIATARRGLEELLGQPVERVAAATREDGGWRLTVDVVELARIPDSTSVLGSYDVAVDQRGDVLEYERVRRYYRNRTDEDES